MCMITIHLSGDIPMVKMDSKTVQENKGGKREKKVKKTKKKQKKKKKKK